LVFKDIKAVWIPAFAGMTVRRGLNGYPATTCNDDRKNNSKPKTI
jgi:hypothetical protein